MKPVTIFLLLTTLLIRSTSSEAICNASNTVYSFKFGTWDATVIKDGVLRNLENFVTNVPSFVVLRYVRFFDPSTKLEVSQNMLLLRNGKEVVLIDTGSGENLVPLMRSVGVSPNDVTAVFLTHAHIDHIRGVLGKAGNAAFPNAFIYLSRIEAEFWSRPRAEIAKQFPNLPFQLIINETVTTYSTVKMAYNGKIRLLNHLESPIRGITAMKTPGHTPGHLAYMLNNAEKKLIVVGDTLSTRSSTIQHPEWLLLSDTNATAAVRARYDLMDKLADEKTPILCYHEEFPGLGFILRDGPSFDFSIVARIG